jgi:hypothetical protein
MQRPDRRRWTCCALLVCATVAAASQAPAAEPESSYNFRVYLNQDPIGYHKFTLTSQGEARQLLSKAHYVVKLLFVTAYHYDHEATEIWGGDCLTRLDSSSDDDGKAYTVHAHGDDRGLEVDAPQGPYKIDGCAMTFAYWNPQILKQSHLINPETGEDVAVTITQIGEETIQVRNVPVLAQHYHLYAAKLEIDLWYSDQGQWLALESPSGKGRLLRYVLE